MKFLSLKPIIFLALLAFSACASLKTQGPPKWKVQNEVKEQSELDYAFLKAQLLLYSNEKDQALEALESILKTKDSYNLDTATHEIFAARILMQQERYDEAEEKFTSLMDEGYDDTEIVGEAARFYYYTNQSDKALELYSYLVQEESEDENNWIYKGLLHTERGEFEEAWTAFETLSRSSKKAQHLGYYYLGKLMLGVGDFKRALSYYSDCHKKKEDFAPCVVDMAKVSRALGREKEATTLLKDFLEKNQSEVALTEISKYYMKEKKFTEAKRYLLQLERVKPQDIDIKRKLAYVLVQQKLYTSALFRLKEISNSSNASEEDHLNTVKVVELDSGAEEALSYVKDLVISRAVPEGVFYKYFQLAKDREEKTNICQKIKTDNTSVCNYATAVFYLSENKIEQAEDHLKDSIRKNENFYKAHYMLGRLLNEHRDSDGIKNILKAIEIKPDYAPALNFISYHWASKGQNTEQAMVYIQKAIAQEPNNGAYIDTYGYLLYKLGEYESSLQVLQSALRFMPKNPVLYEHLADVHRALKNKEAALRFYKLASSLLKGEDLKRLGGKVAKIQQNADESVSSVSRVRDNSDSRMPATFKKDQ